MLLLKPSLKSQVRVWLIWAWRTGWSASTGSQKRVKEEQQLLGGYVVCVMTDRDRLKQNGEEENKELNTRILERLYLYIEVVDNQDDS